MKKFYTLLIAALVLSYASSSQIITTCVGNGTVGYGGDGGAATNCQLTYPLGLLLDNNGNLLICHQNFVRIIDLATGSVSAVAGNDTARTAGDGRPATAAQLVNPYAVCSDANGNLFVTSWNNYTVREIYGASDTIRDFAGIDRVGGSSGDGGPATAAELGAPFGISIDTMRKYIYIADEYNYRVRRIDMATNIISDFAGTGVNGYSGDGSLATNANFSRTTGVSVDRDGNVYIGDWDNGRIRKVDIATNIVTTIAGNGVIGYSGDGGPATGAMISKPSAICFDRCGNLYFTDEDSSIVRLIDASTQIITTIAGNGIAGFSGDGGPASAASFNHPDGICIDTAGNLYIADYYNQRVRKMTVSIMCDIALSTNIAKKESGIGLYPNPTTTQLTVTTPNTVKEVTISNLIGQTIFTRLYDQETAEINTSGLPPGVYLVRVSDGNGNTEVQKILKE